MKRSVHQENATILGTPWQSSGQDSARSVSRAWFQSLVGDRSCTPHRVANKNIIPLYKTILSVYVPNRKSFKIQETSTWEYSMAISYSDICMYIFPTNPTIRSLP